MFNKPLNVATSIILLATITGLSGCSTLKKMGKSARNMTDFSNNEVAGTDDKLVIPPSLKEPAGAGSTPAKRTAKPAQQANRPVATAPQTNGNYYIIVGTYPDQLEAIETFTRLSSIGLKGATMESRRTKAGAILHMVRLGPYTKQEEIDEAKDNLTNTGMSQFKIVKG